MLRGIAAAAPFLGLAGTSYGIMAGAFVGVGMEKGAAMRALIIGIAASLITTAAGILVAVPAAFLHNSLRTRIETLSGMLLANKFPAKAGARWFHFAETLPLKRRFSSLPHFAIVAAPALACVVMMYTAFEPYETPTGLSVALAPNPCEHDVVDRFIVLNVTNTGKLFINMEPVDWKDLPSRLYDIYRYRQSRELYLYAEDGVPVQTFADAVDVARNAPAAGPGSIDIKVILITPAAARQCIPVPIRVVPRKHAGR
jgi:biopolymer transport protein ExbD